MHRLRAIVFISIPAFGVVLLVLEGFFRVSGYVPYYLEKRTFIPSEDPRILYELRPDFQGLFAGVHVTVNSQGFRGKELNPQGTQVYRILLVGDSIAFGQGVEDNDTLAVELADRLQGKLWAPVEVVNLGVSGYNTCQEYWRLKARIGSLDPQAIIWVFLTNDTDRPVYRVKNGTVISPDTRSGWFGEFMAWLRKSSFAYNLAWTRWQLVKKAIRGSGNYRERVSKQFLDSNPEWKKTRFCLENALTMARESSIRTILVPFPVLDGVDETPYPYAEYIRIVCGVAESNGTECVDVVPVLRRSDTRLTVSSVETHPSPFVYERVAEKLKAILSP